VLDLGNGTYAFYAHLLKGTLLVQTGDAVRKGDRIAQLGNTGNSNASHLHFHLMDGPSVLGSHGVPYVISGFDYAGQVPLDIFEAADDYLTGTFGQQRLPTPQPRTNELPLNLTVVNFPE
jgi:murein DD-endopeptidase MepM/ murein hydrolase activator NlpD